MDREVRSPALGIERKARGERDGRKGRGNPRQRLKQRTPQGGRETNRLQALQRRPKRVLRAEYQSRRDPDGANGERDARRDARPDVAWSAFEGRLSRVADGRSVVAGSEA